jgi:acetyl esterase/lipase
MDMNQPLYDPALEAHVDQMREVVVGAGIPDYDLLTPEGRAEAREALGPGGWLYNPSPRAKDREVPGLGGGTVPIRVIEPETTPRAVLIDIHGGGFAVGNTPYNDEMNVEIVDGAGVVTMSVEHRYAPEHPYPAQPDDCEAVALWVLEHAQAEWGVDKVVLAGQSTGACLAVTTMLRLRDRHDALARVVGADLLYGLFDLLGSPSATAAGRQQFRPLYLPDMAIEDRKNPDVSPLYGDLAGMPPALFTVGVADFLYDDTLLMAMRWRAAGNDTELAIYPGSPHGFTYFPKGTLARIARDHIIEWVADRVATS